MPTAKRSSPGKKNGRRNEVVSHERFEPLKKRYLSLRTDETLDRFLTRLTLDELRALMTFIETESRRTTLSLIKSLNKRAAKTSRKQTITLNSKQQQAVIRRYIIKAEYESLKTDRARDRFLSKLSSSELHTLMWDTVYENHQAGRRLD